MALAGNGGVFLLFLFLVQSNCFDDWNENGNARSRSGAEFRIALKSKRPNSSNIKEQIKDIFGVSSQGFLRSKRKSPDRSLSSLRKKLNEDKKKDELMPADAHPRLEPNNTGTPANLEEAFFGGINTEQLYNKKKDKIRLLHLQHNEEKVKDTEETDCNFEKECKWTWRKDIANGFFVTNGQKFTENDTGPRFNAHENKFGKFISFPPIVYYWNFNVKDNISKFSNKYGFF